MTEVKKMGDSEKTKSGSGSLLVFVFAVVDVAIGASVSLTSKYSTFQLKIARYLISIKLNY